MFKKPLLTLLLTLWALPTFAVTVVDTAWMRRFDGPGNWHDCPHVMLLDDSNNIYLAGRSRSHETGWDYLTVKYDGDGNLLWASTFNGESDGQDWPYAMTVDSAGNVYVTGDGYREGSGLDFVTIKYNADGDTAWVRRFNGNHNSDDRARAIGVDDLGNVYVAGSSYDTVTGFDYATVKYDPDGVQLWVREYDGTADSTDEARLMAVEGEGNVYVCGNSMWVDTIESAVCTTANYLIVKYDCSGNELWSETYRERGNGEELPFSMTRDRYGNVYITGKSFVSWAHSYDYATVKYDSDGNQLWVQTYNGPGNDWDVGYAVTTDDSGFVYVTGASTDNFSGYDYATVKYAPDSAQLWAARYNGVGNYTDFARAIAVDAYGSVYVTGHSAKESYYPTDNDFVTIKYDSGGNEVWLVSYNGPGEDPANNDDEACAIAVDADGNIHVAGSSEDTVGYYDFVLVRYFEIDARGDINGDEVIDISDVIHALNYLYKSGPTPDPLEWADVNCDEAVDLSDVIHLINYLFKGGPPPCEI